MTPSPFQETVMAHLRHHRSNGISSCKRVYATETIRTRFQSTDIDLEIDRQRQQVIK